MEDDETMNIRVVTLDPRSVPLPPPGFIDESFKTFMEGLEARKDSLPQSPEQFVKEFIEDWGSMCDPLTTLTTLAVLACKIGSGQLKQ